MHVIDTKKWTSEKCREFVRVANETTDEVLATGELWDAYMRRVAFEYDVIQAVWQDKQGRGGCSFGVVKGIGLLMLISQGTKPVTLRSLKFRVLDYDSAYNAWAMYGDGRSTHPETVARVDAARNDVFRAAYERARSS